MNKRPQKHFCGQGPLIFVGNTDAVSYQRTPQMIMVSGMKRKNHKFGQNGHYNNKIIYKF